MGEQSSNFFFKKEDLQWEGEPRKQEVMSNHSGFDVRFITLTDAIFDSLNSKIQQF